MAAFAQLYQVCTFAQFKNLELVDLLYFNPNRPGRFLKFSKILNKTFKKLISPQLRAPEKQTIARLKGLVLGFHFAQVSSCRRAPLSPEF